MGTIFLKRKKKDRNGGRGGGNQITREKYGQNLMKNVENTQKCLQLPQKKCNFPF